MYIERKDRYFVVRVGERSTLPGVYTNENEAKKALKAYKAKVEIAKAKKTAKKNNKGK